jgi:hypothetical protein
MFNLKSDQLTQIIVIIGVTILLLLLIKTYYYDGSSSSTTTPPVTSEGFYNYDEDEMSPVEQAGQVEEEELVSEGFANPPSAGPQASEQLGMNESYRPVNESGDVSNLGQFLPSECYPKDVLSSADLLPASADSTWAQVVPAGQGALTDQNFLTSGHHIGMNTIGSSLRNASHDLRTEIPNPQVQVSPWNMTTIAPDLMRRPLDGC